MPFVTLKVGRRRGGWEGGGRGHQLTSSWMKWPESEESEVQEENEDGNARKPQAMIVEHWRGAERPQSGEVPRHGHDDRRKNWASGNDKCVPCSLDWP